MTKEVLHFPDRLGEVLREKVESIVQSMSAEDIDTLQNDRVGGFEVSGLLTPSFP